MNAETVRAAALAHLEKLVAFDTRNPPRRIGTGGLFQYVRAHLPASFAVDVVDLGDGCVYLHAVRGTPALTLNIHVDTVPDAPGWQGDPLSLRVEGDRAVGLGACDTKGALAAFLAVVKDTDGPMALLLSSDEEAGNSTCIREFISRQGAPARVVVSEPTGCRAVSVHRGIATASGTFHGTAGHASAARALEDSALHEMTRWAHRALQWAGEQDRVTSGGLAGARFNLGLVEGGTKPNMIASTVRVRFGVRPPPGRDPRDVMREACALAPRADRVTWEDGFLAPPLPAPARPLQDALTRADALVGELGMTPGEPVDFWTEAALFSAAGSTAVVYGVGDIALAHAPGEYVPVGELVECARTWSRIFSGPGGR